MAVQLELLVWHFEVPHVIFARIMFFLKLKQGKTQIIAYETCQTIHSSIYSCNNITKKSV